jgi:hypothetical protein
MASLQCVPPPWPHGLVVSARFWLAAETEDIEEKKRCLCAILDLDPDNTEALLALTVLRTQKPQD